MRPDSLPTSRAEPRVMHIDLNSCFAIIEQQANRLLRGRPIGVAAYDTPRGFVLAASYEAKRMGVKLGVSVREARDMCPGFMVITPDPSKYREAHRRFKELMLEYTSDVSPKSIDEFVLHLEGSPAIRKGMSMEDIALDIKQKISEHLGEAVTVNIGIGPNRFLAKYAAGFDKPNGMRLIDHTNLEDNYRNMDLVDLPGINVRYRHRLQMYGIMTPLDFLKADRTTLEKVVFKSVVGYYWYLRLRGYEIDRFESNRGQVGHQYALPHKTQDRKELARLLMKMCEKVGRRLRKLEMSAGGIHLYLSFLNYQEIGLKDNGFIGGQNQQSRQAWHHGHKTGYRLYSTPSIYRAAKDLLMKAELYGDVRGMSITTFDLAPATPEQLNLFETGVSLKEVDDTSRDLRNLSGERRISEALDSINTRYGEFLVIPGTMMDMQGEILDRIAFGNVRDF